MKCAGTSAKDEKSLNFYNSKNLKLCKKLKKEKVRRNVRREIWCKEEYHFHMDYKQKRNLWSI